jgi:hypothetical protein
MQNLSARRFLYVFAGPRDPLFAIYYDDRPSEGMLGIMPKVLFSDELEPGEAWTLDELRAEVQRRARSGEIRLAEGGRA